MSGRPPGSKNKRPSCNRVRDAQIIALRRTHALAEIARKLGMSRQNVHYVVKRETGKGLVA